MFFPFAWMFSFIPHVPGLEEVFSSKKCKTASSGSCCVTYGPEGVNTSLSAHQIFWELGLMFQAFETHFLSCWAKEKNLIAQPRTFADFLPTVLIYPLSRRSLHVKIDWWRHRRGLREGEKGRRLACSSCVTVWCMLYGYHGWHVPTHMKKRSTNLSLENLELLHEA